MEMNIYRTSYTSLSISPVMLNLIVWMYLFPDECFYLPLCHSSCTSQWLFRSFLQRDILQCCFEILQGCTLYCPGCAWTYLLKARSANMQSWLAYFVTFWAVAQGALKLLGSSNLLASVSQSSWNYRYTRTSDIWTGLMLSPLTFLVITDTKYYI